MTLKPTISFTANGDVYHIPNSWEQLSPSLFQGIMTDLHLMACGELPIAMVRINHVCRVMGWKPNKIREPEAHENLAWLASQITFPILIEYPDNDAALATFSSEERQRYKRFDPSHLPNTPLARYLSRLPYRYVVDSCFCAQLLPTIEIDGKQFHGYKVNTSYGHLTTSLTALQFIEARALLDATPDTLPLLAAILYCPSTYNSQRAQDLAQDFARLSEVTLQAIAFNFRSLTNYLFTRTPFSLLTASTDHSHPSPIATGALESLYALSSDGLGDIHTIEQINLIQYLTILRKKLIDTVRSLHATKMELSDIANETSLPLHIIRQIL